MRYARRTDENQADVIEALEALGYQVENNSRLGFGVPDLKVRGKCALCYEDQHADVEIKSSKSAKLTPAQKRYRQRNPDSHYIIAVSAQDVVLGLRVWC